MKRFMFAVIALSALLGGCAATVRKDVGSTPLVVGKDAAKAITLNINGSSTAIEARDWEPFKGEWLAAMKSAAGAAGASFLAQDGEPHASGQPGTLVAIYVNDYRYISPGARYGFGIMTVNAFVDARAKFSDLGSGQVLGERTYNTSSSAWQGVFSPMTAKQIEAISKDIVSEITGGGGSAAH